MAGRDALLHLRFRGARFTDAQGAHPYRSWAPDTKSPAPVRASPKLGLDIPTEMVILRMRRFLFVAVLVVISSFAVADEPSVDSLPAPVANTLKAEAANGIVRSIETFQWGDSTIYKIAVDQNGQPYLELEIADTGRLVRVDRLAMNEAEEEDNVDASPTPSPSASPHK
jgi:hypothetical protein